jgi:hypothetical protein
MDANEISRAKELSLSISEVLAKLKDKKLHNTSVYIKLSNLKIEFDSAVEMVEALNN